MPALAVKPKLASWPHEKLREDRVIAVAHLAADLHKENVAANDELASDRGYISSDPIGLAGGPNTYLYANANPLRYTDPYGLWTWPSLGDVNNFWGETFGAAGDFQRNYQDMRNANTIGADKYFHCKANCEAAQRGVAGQDTSRWISEGREWFDENIKRDPKSASDADRCANNYGRKQGSDNPQTQCDLLCAGFRPSGLDFRY